MPKEGEQYTPEEWREMYLDESVVRQIILAEKVLMLANRAHKCNMMNHDGALYFAQHHRCPTPTRDYSSRRANKLMRRSK